jgi:hypothetical protein
MSLDINIFKNYLINELFEYDKEGKRITNRELGAQEFNLLSEILRECNAVIAGGSVLGAYIESDLNDVDIYVNQRNAIKLKNRLKELGYDNFSGSVLQPQYDSSFFVQNNILARFPMYKKSREKYQTTSDPYMDIIIVSDNVDVVQVVNNFDLTFCEIWYDGVHVHAADPKGVLEKKGYLKKDYVKKLFTCLNAFTLGRIIKYMNKGFEIGFDPSINISEYVFKGGILSKDCDNKVLTSPEKWLVTLIFKGIKEYLFLPEFVRFIDVDHLLKNNNLKIRKFNELLRISFSVEYWKEPRFKEANNFFDSIIFDILCNCNINNYSIDSITNLFNYLGISLDKRRLFISKLLYKLRANKFDHVYSKYISDIFGINREEIENSYNNMEEEEVEEEDEPLRGGAEEYKEAAPIVVRKRKRDDSDTEEDDEEMQSDEEENQLVVRNNIAGRKRKFDEEESEENGDFMSTDIANITARLSNIRAREGDNIITKKRRLGDDSGEYDEILFVNKSNNAKVNFNRSYLESIIRNKNNLFFECNNSYGRINPNIIYVKIPLNDRKKMYCFISLDNIKDLLSDNKTVYYLYPVILKNMRQKIIYSFASLGNLNRCILNQNILVYRINPSSQIYFEGTEIDERF